MNKNTEISKSTKNSKKDIKKIMFFGIAILVGFVLTDEISSVLWGLVVLIIWLFVIFIFKLFAFNSKYSWRFVFLILTTTIIFSFTVRYFTEKSLSRKSVSSTKIQKNLKKYDGKKFIIESKNGALKGSAVVHIDKYAKPILVYYNIDVEDNYPVNKKCFTGDYNQDCRWVDYYNYIGNITKDSVSKIPNTYNVMYPVFCDSFLPLDDPSVGLTIKYMDCWYGKGDNKLKKTNKFNFWQMARYKNIDEFFADNTLNVYDAQAYTIRQIISKDNNITSSENCNGEDAIKNGKKIRTYKFTFKEK